MSESLRPDTAVVGAGRLARALLPSLAEAGYHVAGIASRRLPAARSARRLVRSGLATSDPARAARAARLILLAVPDREIEGLARRLADEMGPDCSRRTFLHHAGALGVAPLRSIARAGGAVGVLHPLQCVGRSSAARELLRGSRARVEGDNRGLRAARRLARDLGLVPLRFRGKPTPARRAAYHAAASLLSNDVVALLSYGLELMRAAGLERREAMRALVPLTRGTLQLAEQEGLAAALTGPAVRGDAATLDAHLERLQRVSPAAAAVHRLLAEHLAELAGGKGSRAVRRGGGHAGRSTRGTV